MNMFPILLNHDHTKLIGTMGADGVGRFADDQRITREMMFNIFGGAGTKILEKYVDRDGVEYIKVFQIVEFSMTPELSTQEVDAKTEAMLAAWKHIDERDIADLAKLMRHRISSGAGTHSDAVTLKVCEALKR